MYFSLSNFLKIANLWIIRTPGTGKLHQICSQGKSLLYWDLKTSKDDIVKEADNLRRS